LQVTVFHLFHFVLIPYKEKERVSRSFFLPSNGTRFAGLPFESLAHIASAGASLVGARAALRDRLMVFLPRRSHGKNYFIFSYKVCLTSKAPPTRAAPSEN
jgi:hypothetical protein